MRVKRVDNTEKIMDLVKRNDGYCPCRLHHTPDTKCMCKEFRDKIQRKELGKCHCGLYEIIEND